MSKKTSKVSEGTVNKLIGLLQGGTEVTVKDVELMRTGDQITIPEGMTIKEAIHWLEIKEEMEEKLVNIRWDIACFPTDGTIALFEALQQIYGFTGLRGNPSFWGEQPPVIIDIPTGPNGESKPACLGRISPPTFEGGFLQAHITGEPKLVIMGEVKKKFQPQMDKIKKKLLEVLKENSIYRHQAIMLDMSYLSEGGVTKFDPIKHAPTFMDVRGVKSSDLIVSPHVQFELNANVWTLIEQSEACRINNMPLKHGLLLYGPFGTGKTLCAKVTAAKAVESKEWTFIYLQQAAHIAAALKIAQLYAPCVLFAEDIDDVVKGDRTEGLNTILNTLDGIDTKETPIITVLTTNHEEKINAGFLRAGRMDTLLYMGPPDAKTAARFVDKYAGPAAAVDVDLEAVGQAFEGFVPSFIAQAVQKAKRTAINRVKSADITGKVTTEDLLVAAESLRKHRDMVNNRQAKSVEQDLYESLQKVGNCIVESSLAGQPTHKQLLGKTEEVLARVR